MFSLDCRIVDEIRHESIHEPISAAAASSPTGTESPGASQLSPPPSYHDIPGTVPAHRGVTRGPPPSYEDAVDPNGETRVSGGEILRY